MRQDLELADRKDDLLIEDLPEVCKNCQARLCLRMQVLNLALGYQVDMLCLKCLARENEKTPPQILDDLRLYVFSRECFKSQWIKYLDESYCPSPKECYPSVCFNEVSED